MTHSRQYVRRQWRTPKNQGAPVYLAALVVKALRKHGWPAVSFPHDNGFRIEHWTHGDKLPDDFASAISIAVRITARTYRVDVDEHAGDVRFNRAYKVAAGGYFKEVKDD